MHLNCKNLKKLEKNIYNILIEKQLQINKIESKEIMGYLIKLKFLVKKFIKKINNDKILFYYELINKNISIKFENESYIKLSKKLIN